jgi:hypothetical protein
MLDTHASQRGDGLGHLHDIGRLVALSAVRRRREVRRVGLDQQAILGHRLRDAMNR